MSGGRRSTRRSMFEERGLELNKKKSQWMSLEPPPAGWSRFADSTVKLLGAHIALDTETPVEAETAALMRELPKQGLFFQRVRKLKGAVAAAILGKCAVPRMSYVIRTHNPDVTAEPCLRFDEEVAHTWRVLAELDREIDLQTCIVAHLPSKAGGMGFTRSAWIREAAYCGSLGLAGLKRMPTQKAATLDVTATLTKALGPERQALVKANASSGTATWFTDPSTVMGQRDFAAAMRLRLGTAHPGLSAVVTCPGCGIQYAKAAWSQHVIGCTRVRGVNASTRHARLKDAVKKVATEHGVAFAQREPRHVKDVHCRGCGDDIPFVRWTEHARACPMLTPEGRKAKPHASGPDIHLVKGADEIMVDVTVTNPLNPSERGCKPQTQFRRVESEKEAKYAKAVAKEGARLVVAAVTTQGCLSPTFAKLLAQLAPTGFFEARREVTAATVGGAAAALRNAERQLGAAARHDEDV